MKAHTNKGPKKDPHMNRFFNLIFAAAILLLIWPVILIVALLVLFSMGRPVLFIQERIGLGGIVFKIYKFRTMRPPEAGEISLLTDEQRVSKLGRFLRKSSLDELPEFLNILKGDMDLVGPRPLLDIHQPLLKEKAAIRNSVRPGLTGLAQISGRQLLSFSERVDLDVKYIEKKSFFYDLRICLKTAAYLFNVKSIKTGQRFEEVDDIGLHQAIRDKNAEVQDDK